MKGGDGEGAEPGGGVWAAGESCEERVEGADVKGGDGEGADQVEESGLQGRVVRRG